MADAIGRAERRKEIRLALEYVRVAVSLAAIGTVLFAGFQWMLANRAAEQANQIAFRTMYQRINNEWREHTKTFLQQADLWPYFESGKEIVQDSPNYNRALIVADLRLDVMDTILTSFAIQHPKEGIAGWENTFARAFRTGPILCARAAETHTSWVNSPILALWLSNCPQAR